MKELEVVYWHGTQGTIVHLYENGTHAEFEYKDKSGNTLVNTVPLSGLSKSRKFHHLDKAEKRALLKEAYVDDGADEEVATDSAQTAEDPDQVLREVFGYTDETEINP